MRRLIHWKRKKPIGQHADMDFNNDLVQEIIRLGQYSPHKIIDLGKTMNLNVSQSHLCDCGERKQMRTL